MYPFKYLISDRVMLFLQVAMAKSLYAFALIAVFVCVSVEESNGQGEIGHVIVCI